jgi:hypothetical protein
MMYKSNITGSVVLRDYLREHCCSLHSECSFDLIK